ncbi:hypothetical protein PINS_up014338 [Pythium insidiosum]|nr:hypothetical protein PINS_up014338 [Pythium insidiosum]
MTTATTTATATATTTTKRTRKTCALPACSQLRGECMHCACDGRCGRHTRGLCGLRREGNARECRELGCPRDPETCRHSRRATCSHCRYATASASSRKRQRANDAMLASPQSPTSCDALFTASPIGPSASASTSAKRPRAALAAQDSQDVFDWSDDLPLVPRETPRALCEYEAWASRRATCNLVVLVNGVQFNLHAFPMLLRSRRLRTMAHDATQQRRRHGAVVVLELPTFPGNEDAFDAVCVFVYTSVALFSPSSFAALACAIEALELGAAASALATTYLHSLSLSALVAVTLDAFRLAEQHHDDAWRVVVQAVLTRCVDAVARALPRTPRAMETILVLPRALFVRIGHAIHRQEAGVGTEDDQLEAALLLAVHLDADVDLRSAAQRCVSLVTTLPPTMTTSTAVTGSDVSLTELLFQDVELLSPALHVDAFVASPELEMEMEMETTAALDPIAFLFLKSNADVSRIEISSEVATVS